MSFGQRSNRCNVHVRNLAWATSSDSLRTHFSTCGTVLKAEVKRKGSRSCGWGIVEFDSPQTALVAISSMNSTHLDGREIYVREDRGSTNPVDGAAGAGGSVAVLLQAVAFKLASGMSGLDNGGNGGGGETKKLKTRSCSSSPPRTANVQVARAVHRKPTNAKQGHR
jgi:RNA recognition motif-containing protein